MSKLYKCDICSKSKQPNDFYLRSNGSINEYKCKICIRAKRKEYVSQNYDKVRECNRKAVSSFQKRNPGHNTAKTIAYQMKKNQAMPKWLSKEDISRVKSIYKMCRSISKKTQNPHEVDHIIPINGKTVCGLHVPWNLQILTRDHNRKKSNLLLEDIVCSHVKA